MLLSDLLVWSGIIFGVLTLISIVLLIISLIKKKKRGLAVIVTSGLLLFSIITLVGAGFSATAYDDLDITVDNFARYHYKTSEDSLGVVVKAFVSPSDDNTNKALDELKVQKKLVNKYKDSGEKMRALTSIKTLNSYLKNSYSSNYSSLSEWKNDILSKSTVSVARLILDVSAIHTNTFRDSEGFSNHQMEDLADYMPAIPHFAKLLRAQNKAVLNSYDSEDDYDYDDYLSELVDE